MPKKTPSIKTPSESLKEAKDILYKLNDKRYCPSCCSPKTIKLIDGHGNIIYTCTACDRGTWKEDD